ncbi:hypothetical protein GCM10017673_39060 [Streptosporangium violaceochromogenes]|nr:hypothetical protein GCM10017673_39060 [Streptosporangium violaceochromogenes]
MTMPPFPPSPDIVLIEAPSPSAADQRHAMIKFFRARINEKERAAKRTNDMEHDRNVSLSRRSYGFVEHALLHTPSQALREAASDGELLRRYEEAAARYDSRPSPIAGAELDGLHTAVALRVKAFSDQLGYDPAWEV